MELHKWRRAQLMSIHKVCQFPKFIEHVAMDRALDSKSEGLGFDSQSLPCVEVLGKLRIPHCLSSPSRNGYLVHRSKVGSIVAGCSAPVAIGGKV